jgi:DNA-binding CsgD family transcriptional regulator
MRLGPRLYGRLLKLVSELYALRTTQDLLRDAVHILRPLIPSEGCGWFVYDLSNVPRLSRCAETDPCIDDRMVSRLMQTVAVHPFLALWAKQQSPSAVMVSDVDRAPRERHLAEFADVYNIIGRSNLTTPVLVAGMNEVSSLSYRRARKDFTEEHRLVVNLLQPHLKQAWQNARTYEALVKTTQSHRELVDLLTPRELQVATWLSQGKTNREIALILKARPRTVEKHGERILHKLGVENRVAAALMLADAFRHSLD